MRQQKANRGPRRFEPVEPFLADSDKLDPKLWKENIFIGEPASAGSCEDAFIFRERGAAAIIVIPRGAINWKLDPRDEAKRVGEVFLIFHEVAGETDEVRRQLIDLLDDMGRVSLISFVVKIAEM